MCRFCPAIGVDACQLELAFHVNVLHLEGLTQDRTVDEIDASILFHAAEQALSTRGESTTSPTRTPLDLLHSLALELHSIPALLLIFVFDGPDRPMIKRGHRIKTKEFEYERRLKKLCEGLGFEYWLAPGE